MEGESSQRHHLALTGSFVPTSLENVTGSVVCGQNNCLAEMWSGSEEGTYLRRIDCYINRVGPYQLPVPGRNYPHLADEFEIVVGAVSTTPQSSIKSPFPGPGFASSLADIRRLVVRNQDNWEI
jgi:hypothetical protein